MLYPSQKRPKTFYSPRPRHVDDHSPQFSAEVNERMEQYLHYPIHLRGMQRNFTIPLAKENSTFYNKNT
jgi:hypothetical protein